jgi:peptidoglycan/xylan/chitin deacetylase (PgdA/CDA1 family)
MHFFTRTDPAAKRRVPTRDDSKRGARVAGRRAVKALAVGVVPSSLIVWRGKDRAPPSGRASRVALTFDDGPTSLTPAYLEVLARYGARATFFVVGELGAMRRDLLEKISEGGHELAGHGYTHRRFPTLSKAELEHELRLTASLLPPSKGKRLLVRPPHGAVSPRSLFTCARAGFTTVLWSYDSGDSRTRDPNDVTAAFEQRQASTPGTIALLHEGHGWTMQALPSILEKLRKEGHELVTVGEILHG